MPQDAFRRGPDEHDEAGGRVLLVDDEVSFLEPTAAMLRRRGYACGVAPDAEAALEALDKEPFEVVVTDLRMPGNRQLEFVRRLCGEDDAPAVIVVTGFPSVETAVSSIDLRVFAYLVKPVDFDELCERVGSAARQVRLRRDVTMLEERLARIHADVRSVAEVLRTPQPRVDPDSLRRLLDGTHQALLTGLHDVGRLESDVRAGPLDAGAAPAPPPSAGVDLSVLSPRELEVLELIRNGYRVATVARRLFISPHTVRNHLKRIFLKLEVGSQAELLEKLKPLNGE
jgi:two-component system response regulator HydG/two-component system response regulator AtoC